MKLGAIFLTLTSSVSSSKIDFTKWHPPFPGDLRSPCPALNALANHYIIPHNGRNLTVPMLVDAFKASMNVSADFTTFVGSAALPLAPDKGKSGQFSLADISVHGVEGTMEHDGSLSRQDFAKAGDATSFSPAIFKEFLGYFEGKKNITIPLAAKARWGRILTSRRTNPHFSYTASDRLNSYIQSAIYMQSLKEPVSDTVPVEWIKVWFEQERLPWKEGWRPTKDPVSGLTLIGDVLKLAIETPEKSEIVPGADGVGKGHGGYQGMRGE
ncbi:hypothetical protein N0V90_009734 [Kalmusia sp. IMI 367209]|nr:hypothetical protein N0V90_009734 [Kalmusia sp. IMI 367209]